MATSVPHITTPPIRIGVAEAARITGLSADTIRRAADAGKLTHTRTPGGQRRFLVSDVEALTAGVSNVDGVGPQIRPSTPEGPVADTAGSSTLLAERAS